MSMGEILAHLVTGESSSKSGTKGTKYGGIWLYVVAMAWYVLIPPPRELSPPGENCKIANPFLYLPPFPSVGCN